MSLSHCSRHDDDDSIPPASVSCYDDDDERYHDTSSLLSSCACSVPSSLTPPSPCLPEDVARYILDFLDSESIINAALVSKRHWEDVIHLPWHETTMHFDGGGSPLVSNELLRNLPTIFPSLNSVNISDCQSITPNAVEYFIQTMGNRLHSFRWKRSHVSRGNEFRNVTTSCLRALAADDSARTSSCLESLELYVPPLQTSRPALSVFNDNTTLRHLTLEVSNHDLPKGNLSRLESLTIVTTGYCYSEFDWNQLTTLSCPSLRELRLEDHSIHWTGSVGQLDRRRRRHVLLPQTMIEFMERTAPLLEKLLIVKLPIDCFAGKSIWTRPQELELYSYVKQRRGIHFECLDPDWSITTTTTSMLLDE